MASILNATTTSGLVTSADNSGSLQLQTNNGTTAVTIDTSQNVGIGTSSPVFASGGGLSVYNATAARIKLGDSTSGIGSLDGVELIYDDDAYLWNRENTALIFGTNSSERMRITSGGALCVGNTTTINGAIATFKQSNNVFSVQRSGGTEGTCIGFYDSQGDNTGAIYNYDNNTTSYFTSSDYRLKENIAPMTGALDKVAQLKPVTYTWKKSGTASQGFIAHELQAVVPECVVGEKDAVDEEGKPVYQGVDTSFLVATLTAAIQELKAELDTVKAELNTLKNPPVEGTE